MIFLLTLSGLAHGINMFHFPYYENDEGVYLSQAWSIIHQQRLAPYTYWYDHAPGGWIFVAAWLLLTGGVYTFGFSINSGRVFMLILQICSTLFVYFISRKVTKSKTAGVVSALFFSLSPLGIYFHRRLLLDNLMTFWTLLSLSILFVDKLKLKHVMISAVCFGIAVLSKENAIFFIPGFLCTIAFFSHKYHRHFALLQWVTIIGCIVSSYFLYALLKGEFFAYGSPLGGTHPHVSLLETLRFQASRPGGSIFDPEHSTFWHHLALWIRQDPFILYIGTAANIVILFLSIIFKSRRQYLGLALCGLFFWYFLGRGGIVIEFYVIPLLPILGMCVGILVSEIVGLLKKWPGSTVAMVGSVLISVSICVGYVYFSQLSRAFGQNSTGHFMYLSRQTDGQLQAIEWIRKNVSPSSLIVIDNYGYLELRDPQNPSGIVFPKAEWYWKVDQDPQIKHNVIHDSAETIDYIAKTPQMEGDLITGSSPTTAQALRHAKIQTSFISDGWGVEFWTPTFPRQILTRAWVSYKNNFIQDGGRATDPYLENVTTSEGQSYALLRAVQEDDKVAFDQLWGWTKKNLQNNNGLFSWKWGRRDDGTLGRIDEGTASDADEDIATALLFASKRWQNPQYLADAKVIIDGIWKYEVKELNGGYYLVAGNWAKNHDTVITNPSYFAPASYKLFASVSSYNWKALTDNSYDLLTQCSKASFHDNIPSAVFIPPEWCELSPDGTVGIPSEESLRDSNYGYNAVRVNMRLATDYAWNKDPRAKAYLEQFHILSDKYRADQKVMIGYKRDGTPDQNYESVVGYSSLVSNLVVTDPLLAKRVYEEKILPKFYEDDHQSYWEDPKNYYTNNLAWFATALYSGRYQNYWSNTPGK